MMYMQIILMLAFLIGLAGLAFHRNHLLSALLCLETMMLSLFISLSMWTLQQDSTTFAISPLIVLTFSACEASAGLALMVAVSRIQGDDILKKMTVLEC